MNFISWIRTFFSGLNTRDENRNTEALPVQRRRGPTESRYEDESTRLQAQIIQTESALQFFLENRVRLNNRSYHAEDLTIEFLRELIPKTSPYRPRAGEWLRNWDQRPHVPADIKSARDLAQTAIRSQLDQLREEEEARILAEGRRRAGEVLMQHSSRVDKFLEIAYHKVSAPDEYGDENPKALDEEIRRFIRKIAETEVELRTDLRCDDGKGPLREYLLGPIGETIVQALRSRFDNYYYSRKSKIGISKLSGMSGIEFEAHVSDLLRSVGVKDVSATPVTGDQGGDLLFSWNGNKYVVQAKRYSGSVGNKAVQEAYAAKGFYGCKNGWVVTNSTFTPSARALAKELGVVLVDADQLCDFVSFAKLHFEASELPVADSSPSQEK